ncbi:MAG: SDR family oxidoreductase [Chloroflexi bacterium]|nr:SDR family oxidoreductase [Chloroflexota bacterium]
MKKAHQYFENKHVLITGGSSGIGLCIARKLVQMGASVCLLARNQTKLDEAVSTLLPLRVHEKQYFNTLSADVADTPTLSKLIPEYLAKQAIPDVLINAAGVARPGYVEELDLEIFKWTMDIDYHGTVTMTKLLLPHFLERGSGHIINFSSLAGVLGVFGYTAYSAAKFAVRGFTDVLRAEMKPRGINVSIVYPPDTDTPQLTWENQYKPFETHVIANSDKPIPANMVASAVLKAAARNKYAIVPGIDAKLTYLLGTTLGDLVYPIMDLLVANAIKKKQTKHK